MQTITLAANPVNARMINADKEAKLLVSETLSYRVAGAENTNKFKAGTWDGTSSMFRFKTASFPAGFLSVVYRTLKQNGYSVIVARKEAPLPKGPVIEKCKVHDFPDDPRYDYQPETVRRLEKHRQIIAQIATGGGKCHRIGTPILMFDGAVKNVEDVKQGDQLMGPDSSPRNVLSTCSGSEMMYRITPTKGEPYVVNESHVLSLRITGLGKKCLNANEKKYQTGDIVNISVSDYLKQSDTFKHCAKGWRTGVEFSKKDQPVPPYILGIWLGDGSSNLTHLHTADFEVMNEWIRYSLERNDLKLSGIYARNNCFMLPLRGSDNGKNNLLNTLRELNVIGNKHIPFIYKTGSRNQRLEILAGLIDTDGYLHHNHYDIVFKQKALADDTAYLARSLGFAAYVKRCTKSIKSSGFSGEYYRIIISGDVDKIPCRVPRRKSSPRRQKKNVLNVGIKVEPVGIDNYYGFELDGDHMYLMGDFTVTHNTTVAKYAYARFRLPTFFITTRSVLMYQMKDTFEQDMGLDVGVIGDSVFQPVNGFNVAMIQTLALYIKPMTVKDEVERLLENEQASDQKKIERFTSSLAKQKISILERNQRREAFKQELMDARKDAGDIKRKVVSKVKKHMARREKVLKLLSYVNLLILEEAHEASGDSYFAVTRACKNAHYRLSLTATPFMKESEEENYRLMACSGSVAIKVSEKQLIDNGILAAPYFKYVKAKESSKVYRTTAWQRAYKYGIVENDGRNEQIVAQALQYVSHGLSVVIFVVHKKHGEILKEKLLGRVSGTKVNFVFGDHKKDERKAAFETLKQPNILIGSTIMDVGVDVPAIGGIILAGGGKAEVSLRQRIGRALRAKKNAANVCFVTDYMDDQNMTLKRHSLQRRAVIESTPGFGESMVKEFDYGLLNQTVIPKIINA